MKKDMRPRLIPRGLIAFVLCFAFITYPGFRTSASTKTFGFAAANTAAQFKKKASNYVQARFSVPAQPKLNTEVLPVDPATATPRITTASELKLRSASQVRTEAGWYDTAIREISNISSLKLSTAEELAQANAIVDKNVSNLRYNRSKLVLIGLSDSTFINAVRAKAGDSKSAEKFAIELAENATSIFKVSGGASLGDRIRRSLEADVTKIHSVAAKIKRAASELEAKTKTHYSSRALTKSNSLLNTKDAELFQPQARLSDFDIATIVITVAVLAYPPLGLALFTIANFALPGYGGVGLTAVVVLGAASLIDRLISNLGTEEGKDKVAACQQETDAKYRRCIRSAAGLGIFRIPAEAACYADWLLGSAACLVTY